MNANKLFTEFSMKKIWDKLTRHDEAFKTKLLILSSANWVAQDDGTFTNTVSYAGFKETDNVCVDLHDDGTLTDTQITEYEQYIDRFKVIDGGIIAYANTLPTTTLMIVVRGEYEYLVDETDRVKAMITDAYSDEKEYATGDLCIKDNTLIKFIAGKGIGAWDDTVVETTTINKELSLLNSKSTEIESDISSIKRVSFKSYGNAYNNDIIVNLDSLTAGILICSNSGYGVGAMHFFQPIVDSSTIRFEKIVGNDEYITITTQHKQRFDIRSSVYCEVYVVQF